MAISNKRSKRKVSGGRYKTKTKKRLCNLKGLPRQTKVGNKSLKSVRVNGGNKKCFLLNAETVNVYDAKSKSYTKSKILSVIGNPANRHFIRRNIITKGAIIKTELGNVKITSRPGQEGAVNGILI